MKIILDNFSKDECESILKNLNEWRWDDRLGKEPFMFHKLELYKKPHNLKYRIEKFFRIIWPFTKSDYIQPIRNQIIDKYPELDDLRNFFG